MTQRANKLMNKKKQRSAHLLCFAIRARISVYPYYVLSDNREREEGPNLYSLVALEVAEDGEKMQLST